MEEYISGFIEFNKNKDVIKVMNGLNQKYPIVLGTMDYLTKYDQLDVLYPKGCLPKGDFFSFCIGDNDECIPYESSLIDNIDWAPEADFSLPRKANDRIALLIKILYDIVLQFEASRMVLALYDYSQTDTFTSIKNIEFNKLSKVIFEDVKLHNGPPNTLYDISINCDVLKAIYELDLDTVN